QSSGREGSGQNLGRSAAHGHAERGTGRVCNNWIHRVLPDQRASRICIRDCRLELKLATSLGVSEPGEGGRFGLNGSAVYGQKGAEAPFEAVPIVSQLSADDRKVGCGGGI